MQLIQNMRTTKLLIKKERIDPIRLEINGLTPALTGFMHGKILFLILRNILFMSKHRTSSR